MKRIIVTAFLTLLAIGIPSFAHHSISAEFDVTREIKITGVVTKISWGNPHVLIY